MPTVLPKGWQIYDHFAGDFSLAYPGTWTVSDEGSGFVVLDAPNYAFLRLDVDWWIYCGIGGGEDPSEAQTCLARRVADDVQSGDRFRLVGTAVWEDGYYRAYVVEATIYSTTYELTSYEVDIFAAVPGKSGDMIKSVYFKSGTPSLTDRERNQIRKVINSIRIP